MNRKGATFGGWVEVIVFSGIFVTLLGTVIYGMNLEYGQNHAETFGLDESGLVESVEELQSSLTSGVEEGEASFDNDAGLQLSSLWRLVTAVWRTLGNVFTGGWVEDLGQAGWIPTPMIAGLRLLFLISIAFILLKLLLKLKP